MLFDTSFDERVPRIIDKKVQPMLDRLEKRLTGKIDQLTLDVGQFSLETTNNFHDLEYRLSDKIDGIGDKLEATTDMADISRVEVAKVKRKLGLT